MNVMILSKYKWKILMLLIISMFKIWIIKWYDCIISEIIDNVGCGCLNFYNKLIVSYCRVSDN